MKGETMKGEKKESGERDKKVETHTQNNKEPNPKPKKKARFLQSFRYYKFNIHTNLENNYDNYRDSPQKVNSKAEYI